MEKSFEVAISRIQTMRFDVTAKNEEEAIDKALDMAYNEDWAMEDADYEVEDVVNN